MRLLDSLRRYQDRLSSCRRRCQKSLRPSGHLQENPRQSTSVCRPSSHQQVTKRRSATVPIPSRHLQETFRSL
ncbi:hypothetical protein DPMN_011636 [Dreissena polymorpha]|uniref:Uncharacterized protein n=1 Tax=Dreissena polymorpha TaxID=45954 RepID=A0A9D4N4C9_DREPO|nr:hypothetical protein DPMN_011636 [Dreissena polymorpha]